MRVRGSKVALSGVRRGEEREVTRVSSEALSGVRRVEEREVTRVTSEVLSGYGGANREVQGSRRLGEARVGVEVAVRGRSMGGGGSGR